MPLAGWVARRAGGGPIPLADNFDRANTTVAGNGLGSTPTGGVTWERITGEWGIQSNRAFTSTGAASNPVIVVNAESNNGNVIANLNVGTLGGGDGVYFRLVNASNWWRLKMRQYDTSGCSTCTYNEYECYASHYTCGSCTCGGAFDRNCSGCSHSCTHTCACFGTYCSGGGSCRQLSSTCQRSCNCYTNYNFVLDLERMVNGTLTTVATYHVGYNTRGATSLAQVQLRDASIAVFYNAGSGYTHYGTVTDSTHQTATRHGIGRGNSHGNTRETHALDDFSFTPV